MGDVAEVAALQALHHDVNGWTRRLSAAVDGAAGVDAAGVVRVSLGADAEVAEVWVAPQWRTVVGVDALAGAVMDAAARAQQAWTTAWVQRLGDDAAPAVGSADRPQDVHADSASAADPVAAASGIRELIAVLDDVDVELDALRDAAQRATTREAVGVGAGGPVTVRLVGGAVVGVQVDPAWAHTVPASRLGAALTEAWRAAADAQARTHDQLAAASPSLQRLRLWAGDGQQLLHRLGLPAPPAARTADRQESR